MGTVLFDNLVIQVVKKNRPHLTPSVCRHSMVAMLCEICHTIPYQYGAYMRHNASVVYILIFTHLSNIFYKGGDESYV